LQATLASSLEADQSYMYKIIITTQIGKTVEDSAWLFDAEKRKTTVIEKSTKATPIITSFQRNAIERGEQG